MKERPILFSAPMVRALLDGSKTQTRRVCKPAANLSAVVAVQDPYEQPPGQRPPYLTPGWFGDEDGEVQFFSPYGAPGDRLWVRETWSSHACFDHLPPRECPKSVHYWADGQIQTGKGRPSIHMPRSMSRIDLDVTGVRVERLQDISEADAQAEGGDCLTWNGEDGPAKLIDWPLMTTDRPWANGYALLWESINGDGSWEANPWVWVVEFRVLPRDGVSPLLPKGGA